jgi:SnoaL-like domain
MTETEKLLAIEEIKQLRARYFQCVDCKDWKGFLDVFAPDVEFDHRNSFVAVDPVSGASRVYGRPELIASIDTSGWKMKGRDRIAANGSSQFADVSTVHHGFNPQITIHSPDRASGIWAMQDILRFPSGGPIEEIRGYGHYHETYRRIGGRWVIQTTTLKRLRIDVR